MQKKHTVKTLLFPCEDCEARYPSKKGLGGHIRLKHPEFHSNLLNINMTTPHPKKETTNKKRKFENQSELEKKEESMVVEEEKLEAKTVETQTERTNREEFLSNKVDELVVDRDKWENACLVSMKKLQDSEVENMRLRTKNMAGIKFCNELKVENRRLEEEKKVNNAESNDDDEPENITVIEMPQPEYKCDWIW